jgi:pimeloyl-ACP methyl ester carboxylesterase
MPRLEKVLRKANHKTGARVLIIGHSLGGLYARELARLFPDLVERVILLGSPVKNPLDGLNSFLKPIFEFWHRRCADSLTVSPDLGESELSVDPPLVPETLIYSQTDGVVQWQSCIETGANVEAIEVASSHCGLPYSPRVFEIIVDRLARSSERRSILTGNAAAPKFRRPLNRSRVSLASARNHRSAA